jgi:DNA-binding transcriptional MocR family regulator
VTAFTAEASSRELRRRLGPIGWVVLEDLLLDAEPDPATGALVVATSVRRLATQLGLSKDTVARALSQLIEADLVGRLPVSRDAAGRFGRGGYQLHPDGLSGLTLPGAAAHPCRASSAATPRTVRTAATVEQPSLFPASSTGRR